MVNIEKLQKPWTQLGTLFRLGVMITPGIGVFDF